MKRGLIGGGGGDGGGGGNENTHGKKDLLNKSIIVLFQNLAECFLFAVFLTFLTFSSHALIPSSKTGRGPRRPS